MDRHDHLEISPQLVNGLVAHAGLQLALLEKADELSRPLRERARGRFVLRCKPSVS